MHALVDVFVLLKHTQLHLCLCAHNLGKDILYTSNILFTVKPQSPVLIPETHGKEI